MMDLAQRIYRLYREKIEREPGCPLAFVHLPSFSDDVQVRIPSSEKARDVLGWEPLVSLDDMLRRCISHELELAATA